MKTPLRYAGGKSKAFDVITKELPVPRPSKIVSPFFGGGSLEIRWSTELDIEVQGYDVFSVLVNFWNCVLHNNDKLVEQMELLNPTKQEYARIKEELLCWDVTQDLLKDWSTNYYKRTPIQIEPVKAAAYYYFNHNLSYGPMYLGWISKIYEDRRKWNKMISNIAKFKDDKLSVQCLPFQESMPNHKNDFLYLDPPYYLERDKDNKMFKGMYPNANIDVHHSGFDHEKLRDLAHSHNGSFIMSYNNCETIREWYSDFELVYPEWHYSYALGEKRIGKNKVNNDAKKSHEILIIKR